MLSKARYICRLKSLNFHKRASVNFTQTRFNESDNSTQKWVYNLSGFNRYGLMRDDIINEDLEEVQKALELLPDEVRDQRTYRILRAVQLSLTHSILPQEEWVKFEDDVRYLKPWLDEIEKDKLEQQEWNKLY